MPPAAGPAATPTWPAVLTALMSGAELASDDTAWAMDEIMSGNATSAQLAAFAVLLRAKGETPGELAGLVRTMLDHAAPLTIEGPAVDVVGTGADRAHTVNISTMAALVVAGSGRRVVKHGNRAASSACGTADVLEELGVVIDLPAAGVAADGRRGRDRVLLRPGLPLRHAARRAAAARARRADRLQLPRPAHQPGPGDGGVRSAAPTPGWRRSWPPCWPAGATRALVFRGDDGLDELTTTTTSSAWVAVDGTVTPATIDPAALGISPVEPAALRGGDRVFNAAVVRAVLSGGEPAVRDAVLLNAAAAIAAHDGLSAERLHDALARGLRIAAESIDSGAAADLLQRWIAASQEARPG